MSVRENLINQRTQAQRDHIDEAVKDLHDLSIRIDNDELSSTISELRNRIHDPFMFVIVGEVKSGKSSFINALLEAEQEVTAVAPHPMTDTIQQIVFGEEEETIVINPFLKKIHVPVPILQEIAIVDTPGTNTIIENHQAITESFIPASDLIVFVFEAKNPYRQSAWDFFRYISEEWRKKVVFVLQQKDLMPEEDLMINIKGVKDYAAKKGITDPTVFAVSAKQELQGEKEQSGFTETRQFIKENITGGKAPIMKLQNSVATAVRISENIADGLDLRQEQWKADQEFRADVQDTLERQEQLSYRQVDQLVENILAGYDRITQRKTEELKAGLGFFNLLRRSISSVFGRRGSVKQWLDQLSADLEKDLEEELKFKLNDGIEDLAESIGNMVKMIDLKIKNNKTILSQDNEIFSDIAERRENIFKELRETFEDFIRRSESFTQDELFPDQSPMGSNIAAGSGIAAIGIIIATVVQGGLFDITGGVLTAIGLLFAGIGTSGKRRRAVKNFQDEIKKGRQKIEDQISDRLKTYIKRLRDKIDVKFTRFDQMLDKEEDSIQQLRQEHQVINANLHRLQTELKQLMEDQE